MSRRRQAGSERPRQAGSERPRQAGNERPRQAGPECRQGGRDRGSYTAELAAGLPALMLLLLAGLTAVGAVTTRAQCLDAAREAALAASRGAPGAPAGSRAAPDGATVTVVVSRDVVTATVTAPVRILGGRLPLASVSTTAVAAVEPGPPEATP